MKAKITIIFITIFISILLFSCQNTEKKFSQEKFISEKINSLTGKEIILPDSVIYIYKDSIYSPEKLPFFQNKKLKIITNISADCHVCVSSLKKWEHEIMPKIDTSKVAFLFYMNTKRVFSFRISLYTKITLDYPLIIDSTECFIRTNKLENYDPRFTTFLLNRDNKISLVGNPLDNDALTKLYVENINKLLN